MDEKRVVHSGGSVGAWFASSGPAQGRVGAVEAAPAEGDSASPSTRVDAVDSRFEQPKAGSLVWISIGNETSPGSDGATPQPQPQPQPDLEPERDLEPGPEEGAESRPDPGPDSESEAGQQRGPEHGRAVPGDLSDDELLDRIRADHRAIGVAQAHELIDVGELAHRRAGEAVSELRFKPLPGRAAVSIGSSGGG